MRRKITQRLPLIICAAMVFSNPVYAVGTSPTQTVEATVEEPTDDAEFEGGDITPIETVPVLDEYGNITVNVQAADNVVLPLEVTMKGSGGPVKFTLARNGQDIKMKPDSYKITKVIDGRGKRLSSGAYLTITEEGGLVYLDFTKPDTGFNLIKFLTDNLLFIPFVVICFIGFYWYIKKYH